jgi:hypothetical protein
MWAFQRQSLSTFKEKMWALQRQSQARFKWKNRGFPFSLPGCQMQTHTGMTKMPFPYQDTNYKNADREMILFFHCQDTNTTQTWITQKRFSISRIPIIKMQTGNQIVFPLPEYQYNADMNNK